MTLLEYAADLQAIHLWHHDVENKQIDTFRIDRFQAFLAAVCPFHLKAMVRQQIADKLDDIFVVIDD